MFSHPTRSLRRPPVGGMQAGDLRRLETCSRTAMCVRRKDLMISVGLLIIAGFLGFPTTSFADEEKGVTLYVSTEGDSDWSGRLPEPDSDGTDGPLPSIAAARDAIRAMREADGWEPQPICVVVRGGTYPLRRPIVFGPQDSGTADAPIVYAAHDGETPVISGGRRITGWKTVKRNDVEVWAVEIPELKNDEADEQERWYFRQLFVNGERRPRTRLPEDGFYLFTGLPEVTSETAWNQGQTQARFVSGEIRNWKNLADVEVVALHFWIESRLPLAEVDEAENVARFACRSNFRLTEAHNPNQFARYYVENVGEALERPGQWYLDRAEAMLYYVPMPDESPDAVSVIVPRLPHLLHVVGSGEGDDGGRPVSHLTFDGLTFAHADWSLPSNSPGSFQAAWQTPGAVLFRNARSCTIRNGVIAHVSSYAIEVDAGCRNIAIENNELTDLGAGGVKIWHDSSHTTVTNNEIGPGGRIFHSAVGVLIGRSNDNSITHNHIHDLYYTGISVGWNWGYGESRAARNVIEYNHIHDIGQGWLSDMGGIYTLGVSPGTRLRYNLIHDIDAFQYGGWGLYTDEGSSDILLENNIVYRTKHGGFHQHYGRENMIRNNIFAFGRHAQLVRTREEEHVSFTFERNIVYFNEPTLLGSNWKNDMFKMDHNVYFRTGQRPFDFSGATLDEWRERGHDTHSVVGDPLFADAEKGDFTLGEDSPALRLGFRPIDTSRIGRTTRPETAPAP